MHNLHTLHYCTFRFVGRKVAQKAAAKVYDVMGRCVSTHALEPGINTIDNPANSGVYILKIMFEDIKDVKTLRFIVEK